MVVVATTLIVTASLVLVPSALEAAPDAGGGLPPCTPEHRRVIDLLAELIERSRAVVLANDGTGTSSEMVLWVHDAATPGVVDPDEVGMITHSEVSQVVSFLDRPEEAGAGTPVAAKALADRAFVSRWRSAGGRRRVIARGVSDFRVRWLDDGRLEISLTWPAASSDASDKAVVVVEATRSPSQE